MTLSDEMFFFYNYRCLTIFTVMKINWGAKEYTKYRNMNESRGEGANESQRR
jgi:hypothetical protein